MSFQAPWFPFFVLITQLTPNESELIDQRPSAQPHDAVPGVSRRSQLHALLAARVSLQTFARPTPFPVQFCNMFSHQYSPRG